MSLFADSRYHWRETYFVLFDLAHRPLAADFAAAMTELGSKIQILDISANKAGLLKSCTILCHADSAGMDLVFVKGEEVAEQVAELKTEWRGQPFTPEEKVKVERALKATARFDLFHFEERGDDLTENDDEAEILDPATLLLVLNRLARLSHGVSVDPQSGSVL